MFVFLDWHFCLHTFRRYFAALVINKSAILVVSFFVWLVVVITCVSEQLICINVSLFNMQTSFKHRRWYKQVFFNIIVVACIKILLAGKQRIYTMFLSTLESHMQIIVIRVQFFWSGIDVLSYAAYHAANKLRLCHCQLMTFLYLANQLIILVCGS